MTARPDAAIRALRVAAYRVPADAPEADGTFAWDATTLVLVELDAGGLTGLGYTYADASLVRLIDGHLRDLLEGADALAMVSLRMRPEWFKARSQLGYGFDWPLDWQDMWRYYAEVEQALKIAGPVRYPWGPKRPRYPYRQHEVNASGLALAKACEAMGVAWSPTPLATLSAPRNNAPPCVYRGFCVSGCSTNAKQSVLNTWIPRALDAGAETRDLAMVGRIETDAEGLASGVHYHREGRWRFQRARHVVVAGYAIETPRLLLNSANVRYPDGLANSSGLVGTHLMAHTNQAVWGEVDEEIRWYKGPPSLAVCEHWNYEDRGKDFHGGYAFMSQGPLPAAWAATQTGNHGLWGQALVDEMQKYNHQVGLKTSARPSRSRPTASLWLMKRISTACRSPASHGRCATTTSALSTTPSTSCAAASTAWVRATSGTNPTAPRT